MATKYLPKIDPKTGVRVNTVPKGMTGDDAQLRKDVAVEQYASNRAKNTPKKANILAGTGPSVGNPAAAQMAATPGPLSGSAKPAPNPNPSPVLPVGTGVGGLGTASTGAQQQAAGAIANPLGTAQVTDPWNGFASRYAPGLADALYANPSTITGDVLSLMGLPNNNLARGEMQGYTGNALYNAMLMGMLVPGGAGDEATVNATARLIQSGLTPGGSGLDYRKALPLLFGGTDNPALSAVLFGGPGQDFTLDQEYSALKPLFQAAAGGANPLMQQAMMNMLAGAQNSAYTDTAHGQVGKHIIDYLRQNLQGVVPGL